jgi:hypothetical protein
MGRARVVVATGAHPVLLLAYVSFVAWRWWRGRREPPGKHERPE